MKQRETPEIKIAKSFRCSIRLSNLVKVGRNLSVRFKRSERLAFVFLFFVSFPLASLFAQAPTIVSYTPTRNALNVAKNSNITITFDQGINQSTLTNSTIKINGSLSGRHITTFDYNSSTKTVTITPNIQFKVGDVVTVTASRGIKSLASDSMAAAMSWSFTVKAFVGSGQFTQSSTSGVGSSPYSVTTGDFNNDGALDLATANMNSDNVSILFNSGSGTFTQNSTPSAGHHPRSIASGDFNGDGYLDLAVANSTPNTISILLNNGSGTFTQSSTLTVEDAPVALTLGDFNGDGSLDIAAANGASVWIYSNNGSGIFTQSSTSSAGSPGYSVTSGDFNSDGSIDLAVANYFYSAASILLNNGSGFFTLSSTIDVESFPNSVTSGDFNSDGAIDVAVANIDSNTVSILLNNGKGTFRQSSTPRVGSQPNSVTSGDLNGDGTLDLAVANSGSHTVTILLNDGNGVFTQSSTAGVGSTPILITTGDFNNDGVLDLAVANYNSNTVSILLNTALSPTITSFTPASGPIGSTVSITGTNFNKIATNNIVYFGAVKATVTSSTSTSISVIAPIGATYMLITVTDVTTGLTAYSTKPFSVTFPSNRVIDANSFMPKVDFTTGPHPYDIAVGDIDGDAKPDIVVVNQNNSTMSIFRNVSTSGFITTNSLAPRLDISTGSSPLGVAIGDVDGDGKSDIVIANSSGNSVSVFRNITTSGSITTNSFASKVDFTTGTNSCSVAIGDVDGDGRPDLVVTNYSSNTVSILRNTSTSGSITINSFASKVDFTTGSGPQKVVIGDVDGDGKPDLVVTNQKDATVSVFKNTSISGSVTTNSYAPKIDFTTGPGPAGATIGDIDGDDKQDIIVANLSGATVSILRNTCIFGSVTTSSFAPKVDFTVGNGSSSVAVSDVDGDGKLDLIADIPGNNNISVSRNTSSPGSIASSSFASRIYFAAGYPLGVAVGDIDGDGNPDLIVTNGSGSDNTISILRNTMGIGNLFPHVPQNLTATAGNGQVTLKWSKNTEADFLKYRIYMGSDSISFNLKDSTSTSISDTSKIIASLTNGTKYYFRVSALDSARLESGQSIAASATPAVLNALREYNPDANTVLLMHMDEAAGSSVSDASNYNNNGTATGMTIQNGRINKARAFNGSSDKIIAPNSSSLNITGSLSIDAWIFQNDTTLDKAIVRKSRNSNGEHYSLYVSSGRLCWSALDLTPTNLYSIGQVIRLGAWNHVAATYDSITKAVRIYANGQQVGFAAVTGNLASSTSSIGIGAHPGQNVYMFNGIIDEVRISNIARAPQEFNLQLPPINLSASSASSAVNLTWQNGGGAVPLMRYKIYRGADSTNVSLIDSTAQLLYTNSSLVIGNSYYYRVSAVDSTGFEGAKSYAASATPIINPELVNVTFRLNTSTRLDTIRPATALVQVRGDTYPLTWDTDALTMTNISGDYWSATASFVHGTTIQYKYYASDWESTINANLTVINDTVLPLVYFNNGTTPPFRVSDSIDVWFRVNMGSLFLFNDANDIVGVCGSTAPLVWGSSIKLNQEGTTKFYSGVVRFPISARKSTIQYKYIVNFNGWESINNREFVLDVDTTLAWVTYNNDAMVSKSDTVNVTFLLNTSTIPDTLNPISTVQLRGSLPTFTWDNTSVRMTNIGGDFWKVKVPFVVERGTILSGQYKVFTNVKSNIGAADAGWENNTTGASGNRVFSYGPVNGNKDTILILQYGNGSKSYQEQYWRPFVPSADSVAVMFRVNMQSQEAFNKTTTKVGLRGNMAPLDWGRSIILERESNHGNAGQTGYDGTNFWSVVVKFPKTALAGPVQYKFVQHANADSSFVSTTSWEIISDRNFNFRPSMADTTLYWTWYDNQIIDSYLPPTITDFSPKSGPIGTKVVITGTNFNVIPRNNVVYFGSVKTNVDSSTSSQLYVSVPLGTNYAPITITDLATKLTSYSLTPFNVTFSGSDQIGFESQLDYAFGNPYRFKLIDIDGDGKLDIVSSNSYENNITIRRNMSSIGVINFSNSENIITASDNYDVAYGDLDGDGRPDLAVPNFTSKMVSILQNVSTPSGISFLARQDINTSAGPYGIAIIDIDGDGKPDIVVSNADANTVSIFRNTSNNGILSFTAKYDFATALIPYNLQIGDLDGDGKPDIAVTCGNGNVVSVLRNLSVPDTIVFSPKVDLPTNVFPQGIALGDINQDGKLDIAVAHANLNKISILINQSSSGGISFSEKQDFTTLGWGQGIYCTDMDGDGKLDLLTSNGYVNLFLNQSTQQTIALNATTYGDGTSTWGILAGDLDLDGKPDIIAASPTNSKISIFRNKGMSLRPNAPSKLITSSGATFQINLMWNDNSSDETGFKIERKIGRKGTYTEIGTVGQNVNGFINVGVKQNVTYYYRVYAYNTYGNSAFSNEIAAVSYGSRILDTIPPSVPRNLTAISGNGQVLLKWRKNDEIDFLKYYVYSGIDTVLTLKDSSNTSIYDTSKVIAGLINGTKYYFTISAMDSSGNESGQPFPTSATPTSSPILSVNPSTLSFGNIALTTTSPEKTYSLSGANLSPASGNITVTAPTAFGVSLTSDSGFASSLNVPYTNGTPSTTIYVNFSPVSLIGYSGNITNTGGGAPAQSVSVSGTGVQQINAPSAPTNLSANVISGSQINLSWTDNSNNEDGFKVERKIGAGGTYALIANLGANVQNYTNTGLAELTNYYYRVYAYNTGGNSGYSNEANATTKDATSPAAPTAAQISPSGWTNQSTFNLSWTNPIDPSGIAKVWYIIDTIPTVSSPGKAVAVSSQSLQINLSSAGTHQIYFYLEDSVGNKNAANYVRLTARYDNIAPVVLLDSSSVPTFYSNNPQNITLSSSVIDNHSGPKSLVLHYRRAGTNWSGASSVPYNSFNGSSSIPSSFILNNYQFGVDFRSVASDSANNVACSPTYSLAIRIGTSEIPRTDASGVQVYQPSVANLPTGAPAEYAYRLFSVPLNLDNKTPFDVFENRTLLGAYDVKKWRFSRWNNITSEYQDYPLFKNENVLTPGSAFFLIMKSGVVVKAGSGSIIRSDSLTQKGIPLISGNNYVGNPFNFDVPMDSLSLADGTSLLNKTWSFVGVGGTNAGWLPNPSSLKAWEGIFIKLTAPNTLRFHIADRPQASIRPLINAKIAGTVDSTKQWTVRIKASRADNQVADEENLFGISGGYKPPLFEPPMVGEKSVSVAFDSPDGPITHDLRSAADSGWVWDFRVATPDAGAAVKLGFENLQNAGSGYLIDKNSKMVYKLQEVTDMKTTAIKGGREYRIIVGSKSFAEANSMGVDLFPKDYVLYQNYPNPFNPSTMIRFSLPAKSSVKLMIYDLLGREIVRLLDREMIEGYQEVEWRASVSTGIYFYRLEAAALDDSGKRFVEVRKMVLIK